jgi:hypothetical protein
MVERVKSVKKRKSRPFVYHYKPAPGKVELELWKACNFKRKCSESRQEELYRLLDTIIMSKLYLCIDQEAAGWVIASCRYYNDGFEVPEPDKSKWLPPTMQHILGAATMKRFMKREFVESKRERKLFSRVSTHNQR